MTIINDSYDWWLLMKIGLDNHFFVRQSWTTHENRPCFHGFYHPFFDLGMVDPIAEEQRSNMRQERPPVGWCHGFTKDGGVPLQTACKNQRDSVGIESGLCQQSSSHSVLGNWGYVMGIELANNVWCVGVSEDATKISPHGIFSAWEKRMTMNPPTWGNEEIHRESNHPLTVG